MTNNSMKQSGSKLVQSAHSKKNAAEKFALVAVSFLLSIQHDLDGAQQRYDDFCQGYNESFAAKFSQ